MKINTAAFALALATLGGVVQPAMAASDDECGNWLCLPAGYPGGAGCEGPYDAMKERLRDLKPPLPAFSSCISNDVPSRPEYQMTSRDGIATYYDGAYHKGESCRWRKDEWIPHGCMGRNYWYVEVFDYQGNQLGPTQYIRK